MKFWKSIMISLIITIEAKQYLDEMLEFYKNNYVGTHRPECTVQMRIYSETIHASGAVDSSYKDFKSKYWAKKKEFKNFNVKE